MSSSIRFYFFVMEDRGVESVNKNNKRVMNDEMEDRRSDERNIRSANFQFSRTIIHVLSLT